MPEQPGPDTAYAGGHPGAYGDPVPGAPWPRSPRGDLPHEWTPRAGQPEIPLKADPAWGFPQQQTGGSGRAVPPGAGVPWPAGPESGRLAGGPGTPRDPWRQDGRDTGAHPFEDPYAGPHTGPVDTAPYAGPQASPRPERVDAAAGPDADVDPHEVTVQLDAVQLGEGLIRRAASAGGTHEPSDGPVFVDESGRRSRLYRRLGMAVGVACAVYAVVIVVTLLSGSSDAPWLPVPGQKGGGQPAGRIGTGPAPGASASPSGTATGSPGPGDSASPAGTTSPAPGTGAAGSGAPAADEAGASTGPQPAGEGTASRSGTGAGGADPAPAKPATPPAAGDPDPEPEPTGPTGTPTETASGGAPAPAPASDTLAAGPAGPAPVAAGSREERGARSPQSPEYVL
ncbi:MAG TPA: hypothetical protein VFP69_06665 [Streptomyces sp.]|nr:hypothetical protein [Streptomyces sp.]